MEATAASAAMRHALSIDTGDKKDILKSQISEGIIKVFK